MNELASLPTNEPLPMHTNTRRACDDCRIRKVKCIPTVSSCESCEKRRVSCTFDNPILKRGPKPRSKDEQGDTKSAMMSRLPALPLPEPGLNLSFQKKIKLEDETVTVIQPPSIVSAVVSTNIPFPVKADEYGSLNVAIDAQGRKTAHFYLAVKEPTQPIRYTPVSSTSLVNHPLSYITANTCQTHPVLGLLTSQQIYITIIFFTYVYPLHPTLNLSDFDQQLRKSMTTSLLFLLNCICAVACPYGSSAKARFDKTQFFYKALEIHYHNEEPENHHNWAYGHELLSTLKPQPDS